MKCDVAVRVTDIQELVRKIGDLATGKTRALIAIAGPPGSGKSTLAEALAARLAPTAAVLPMDGFHLDNAELIEMDLLHRKGAPETFDATGFIRLVRLLRTEGSVCYPTFDRTADKTVPDGGRIDADTRVVLIEGNYTLLNVPPWDQLQGCFDLTVGLEVDPVELEQRLVTRWLNQGLSLNDARARAIGNDMKNALFVERHSFPADLIFAGSS